MGRRKADFPKGNFVFKNKANSKGERTLYLQYNVNGVPASISTNISTVPSKEWWDAKNQLLTSKNSNYTRLNNQLKKKRDVADEQIQSYEGRLTANIVRKILQGDYQPSIAGKTKDFVEYALEYNQNRYNNKDISYSTFNNARYYIHQFQDFLTQILKIEVLSLAMLNIEVIDKFKAHCLKKGNGKETINKKITPLLKATKYAFDNGYISHTVATPIAESYIELKERQYKSAVEDKEVHYLTPEQMQEFVNHYSTVKHNRTREIMDMFMFSFYACGLRFSDILTLEWTHINFEEEELTKNLYKGKVAHTIPLTAPAIEILKRWEQKKCNGRFVFDLLPSNFDLDNVALLDDKRKSKNRILQTSLTAIGDKFNPSLPFNLTIHVARHSFAVMALDNGVTVHIISKLLGHSSILTTEKVYAEHLPATINEEVKSKLAFHFSPIE